MTNIKNYKFEIEGLGDFETDDPQEIIDALESHIEEGSEKVIIITIEDIEL